MFRQCISNKSECEQLEKAGEENRDVSISRIEKDVAASANLTGRMKKVFRVVQCKSSSLISILELKHNVQSYHLPPPP